MVQKNSITKLAISSVLGLVLSYTFVVLAVLPIRYLRLQYGRATFWAVVCLGSGSLLLLRQWQWASVYLSLCLLIGTFREFEERRLPLFISGLVSIATASLGALILLYSFLKITKKQWLNFLTEKTQPLIEQFRQIPRFEFVETQHVIGFLPTGLILTLMMVLFLSLAIAPESRMQKKSLLLFRLPDWMIWAFISSLALTFLPARDSLESFVGLNALILCLAAYFFQGLAVFVSFLDRFAIYGFWRMLALFLVFFQMFLFICGLGILDFWIDFRSQFKTKKLKQKTFQ